MPDLNIAIVANTAGVNENFVDLGSTINSSLTKAEGVFRSTGQQAKVLEGQFGQLADAGKKTSAEWLKVAEVCDQLRHAQTELRSSTDALRKGTGDHTDALNRQAIALKAVDDLLVQKTAAVRVASGAEKELAVATIETAEAADEAKGAFALAGEEIGIKMNRHVRAFMADLPLIGPLMSSAFNAFAIFAVVELLSEVPEAIEKIINKLAGWGEAAQKAYEKQTELNRKQIEFVEELEVREHHRNEKLLTGSAKSRAEVKAFTEDLKSQGIELNELLKRYKDANDLINGTHKVTLNSAGPHGGTSQTVTVPNSSGRRDSEVEQAKEDLKNLPDQIAALHSKLEKLQKEDIPDAMVAGSKEAINEARDIAKAQLAAKRESAMAKIALDEEMARAEAETGKISAQQEIVRLTALETNKYELQKKFLQDSKKLHEKDPAKDAAYQANLNGQLESLESSHQAALTKLKVEEWRQKAAAGAAGIENEIAATKQGSQERVRLELALVEYMRQTYGLDSEEYKSALRSKIEAERQYAEQQRQIAIAAIDAETENRKAAFDRERLQIDFLAQHKILTEEKRLAALANILDREYQMELRQFNRKLALDGLEQKEKARMEVERDKRVQKHATDELKIDQQTASRKFKIYDTAFGQINNAFHSALSSMGNGNGGFLQSLGQSWNGFVANLGSSFERMVMDWLGAQIKMTLIHQAAKTTEVATHAAAEETKQAVTLAGTIKDVFQSAKKGAARAYASVSDIPIIGPALAPIAAAAAFAGIMAFGSMASAAGGWGQVPEDQIAQVHKDEMILPAPIAGGLRSVISSMQFSPGTGSAGPTSQPTVHHAEYYSAIDGQSVRRMVRDNRKSFAKEMKRAMRMTPRFA
jgi:hypothetical protein